MENKLPYYMTYPMPLVFDDERKERMDFEYIKSMYPDMAKKLLPYVEDECDRMEFEGSMLFDEYPDRLSLLMKSKEVWENAGKNEDFGEKAPAWEELQDLIGVLLLQEMLRRRKKNRSRSGGMLY